MSRSMPKDSSKTCLQCLGKGTIQMVVGNESWDKVCESCKGSGTNDRRPHSRACGWQKHDHGTACHPNCPTCAGTAALSPQTKPQEPTKDPMPSEPREAKGQYNKDAKQYGEALDGQNRLYPHKEARPADPGDMCYRGCNSKHHHDLRPWRYACNPDESQSDPKLPYKKLHSYSDCEGTHCKCMRPNCTNFHFADHIKCTNCGITHPPSGCKSEATQALSSAEASGRDEDTMPDVELSE